jgi:hypothetical protein
MCIFSSDVLKVEISVLDHPLYCGSALYRDKVVPKCRPYKGGESNNESTLKV